MNAAPYMPVLYVAEKENERCDYTLNGNKYSGYIRNRKEFGGDPDCVHDFGSLMSMPNILDNYIQVRLDCKKCTISRGFRIYPREEKLS